MRKSTIILIAISITLIIMCSGSTVLLHHIEPRVKQKGNKNSTTTSTTPTSSNAPPEDKKEEQQEPSAEQQEPPADQQEPPAEQRSGSKYIPVRLSLNDFNATRVIKLHPTTVKVNNTIIDNPDSNAKAVVFKFIDEQGIPKFELKINNNDEPKIPKKPRRSKPWQDNNNREVVLNIYNTHIATDDYYGEPKLYHTSPFITISKDAENTNKTLTTKATPQIQKKNTSNDSLEYENFNITGIVTALKTMKNKIMKMYRMLPNYKNEEENEMKMQNKRNSSTIFIPDTSNDNLNDTILSHMLFDKKPKHFILNNTDVLNSFVSVFTDIAKDDLAAL